MNVDIMQKAHELSHALEDTQEAISELEKMQKSIKKRKEKVYLRVPSGYSVIVSSSVALQWLDKEKPQLETEFKRLKKEFEDL